MRNIACFLLLIFLATISSTAYGQVCRYLPIPNLPTSTTGKFVFKVRLNQGLQTDRLYVGLLCSRATTLEVNMGMGPNVDVMNFQSLVDGLIEETGPTDRQPELNVTYDIARTGPASNGYCPSGGTGLISGEIDFVSGGSGVTKVITQGLGNRVDIPANECVQLTIFARASLPGIRQTSSSLDPNVNYRNVITIGGAQHISFALEYENDPTLPPPTGCTNIPNYYYDPVNQVVDFDVATREFFDGGGEMSRDFSITYGRRFDSENTECNSIVARPEITMQTPTGDIIDTVRNVTRLNNGTSLALYAKNEAGFEEPIEYNQPFDMKEIPGVHDGYGSLESTKEFTAKWMKTAGEAVTPGLPWRAVVRFTIKNK